MTVSEMELVGRLAEVASPSEETFEHARTALRAAIAAEDDTRIIEFSAPASRRRRRVGARGLVTVGVAAAAVAVAMVASSPGQGNKVPAASHDSPLLVRLAAAVSSSPALVGDAELVARTTTGGGQSVTVYDLYADNGGYFFSPTQGGLAGQVSANHDMASGLFTREMAAARLATTGDVQTAVQDMADAADPNNIVSPTQAPPDRGRPGEAGRGGLRGREPVRQLRVGELPGRDHREFR